MAEPVRLFDKVLTNYGLTFTYVDTSVAENVAAAITPATKLVHIETPTNPMMSLTDVGAVARICHAKGVELSVDNTFPVAVSAAADRAGCGYCDALDDEVPERTL